MLIYYSFRAPVTPNGLLSSHRDIMVINYGHKHEHGGLTDTDLVTLTNVLLFEVYPFRRHFHMLRLK